MASNNTYYAAVATAVLKDARDAEPEPGYETFGIQLYQVIEQKIERLAEEYKEQNSEFNELVFKAEVLQRIADMLQKELRHRALGHPDKE